MPIPADAQWVDRSTVLWQVDPVDGRRYELTAGGHRFRLYPGKQTEQQRRGYPHLWRHTALNLEPVDAAVLRDALRGAVTATEYDDRGDAIQVTGVQLPGVLDDLYAAALAAPLGPAFRGGRAGVAVWAPTAVDVALELRDHPDPVPMARDDDTGVWHAAGDWAGRHYRFRVTVWQPAAGAVVTASVTDPYAVDLSVDSVWSRFTDLDDPALAPPGWAELHKLPVPPGKIQIQELSVRDFSIADPTVPAAHRGTYLAFGYADTAGMAHLRSLAGAGLTHIHLLPVFDFSSVPDRRPDQDSPGDLSALPPDSAEQQARIAAVADRDGYNWGYDPWHYTAPEGSYAYDPDHRVYELRAAVAGLADAGLRTVLDVVYNHTVAAGDDPRSVLDRIVPGYYHRLLDDGTVADSTCCANTAPEHAMMGRLVVDSVLTWARQYKVDGFRFDLMGHHPKANIVAVRAALDALTPERDGVDGRGIYLYGEGWNFGEVVNDARFVQASQDNMAGTGVGTFNDRMRDAVRGGGAFDSNPRQQGFGTGLLHEPNGDAVNGDAAAQRAQLLRYQDVIKVGLTGNLAAYRFQDSAGHDVTGAEVKHNGLPVGYAAVPAESVTYVDAHDNEILYDALAFKLPQRTSAAERARMQVLALATTILGQGVGFCAAGSDRLRSKSLDRNSFNSGDWFNAIHWADGAGNGFGRGLPPGDDNAEKWGYARPLLADPALVAAPDDIAWATGAYRDLLRIRAASDAFGLATAEQVQRRVAFPRSGPDEEPGVLTMTLAGTPDLVVVFNATPDTVGVPLSGADLALHPVQAAGTDDVVRTARHADGVLTVPGRTVAVFCGTISP